MSLIFKIHFQPERVLFYSLKFFIFFTKSAITYFLTKFSCFNFAVKFADGHLFFKLSS